MGGPEASSLREQDVKATVSAPIRRRLEAHQRQLGQAGSLASMYAGASAA